MLMTALMFAMPVWSAEGVPSRGFQQARRVAAMELSKDLPSRAVWLGSRVVNRSKSLAVQSPSQERRRSSAQ